MAEDIERVTPAQIESLRKSFFEKVASSNPDFCTEDLDRVKTDSLWMRRFIAAQENDVPNAVTMLYETCQWRKEFGTNDLDHNKLKAKMLEKGVLFVRGKDNWGKNVLVFKAKFHNKGVDDIEDVKKFIVYYFERIERVSESDQISVIFDMKDTGWSNMDMDFIRYLITLLKQYYPYFVNYLMIFEMPWLLKSAWNIIKGWLPPKFVDRVKFVDKKTIKEFINEKNQLTEWGGQDDYKYSFEPEVRLKARAPKSPAPDINANTVPPIQARARKVSNKVKFSDRDGSIDTHDVYVTEEPGRPGSRTEQARRSATIGVGDDVAQDQHPVLAVIDETIIFRNDGPEIVGRFNIENVSRNGEAIIFKLKTTSPDKFRVRPTIGIIDPGLRSEIKIAAHAHVPLRTISAERFQIQITVMPPGMLIGGSDTESESASNASRGFDFTRLNGLWKQIISVPGKYVENHRLGCALDLSTAVPGADGLPLAATGPSVTMGQDDMRKGLADLEKKMSDSTSRILEDQLTTLYTYVYIMLGLLGFCALMLIVMWWSMPAALVLPPPNPNYDCLLISPGAGGDPGSGSPAPHVGPGPVPHVPAGPAIPSDQVLSCIET